MALAKRNKKKRNSKLKALPDIVLVTKTIVPAKETEKLKQVNEMLKKTTFLPLK